MRTTALFGLVILAASCTEKEFTYVPLQASNSGFIIQLADSDVFTSATGDTAYFLLEAKGQKDVNGPSGERLQERFVRGYFSSDSSYLDLSLTVQLGVDSLGSGKGELLEATVRDTSSLFVRQMKCWVFPAPLAVQQVQLITDSLTVLGSVYLNAIQSTRDTDFNSLGVSINSSHSVVEFQDVSGVQYRKISN